MRRGRRNGQVNRIRHLDTGAHRAKPRPDPIWNLCLMHMRITGVLARLDGPIIPVDGVRARTRSSYSGRGEACESLAAIWVGEHCHPRTGRAHSRCLARNGHVGGRCHLLLAAIPRAVCTVCSGRGYRRRRLSASLALQPPQCFYRARGWRGGRVFVLLPDPGTDRVDSFCNRYAVRSVVVGQLFVLDGHACLRISSSIVLDRHRRVSHVGDIDSQNARRSGDRRRAVRAGGGSAISGVQPGEAQSRSSLWHL